MGASTGGNSDLDPNNIRVTGLHTISDAESFKLPVSRDKERRYVPYGRSIVSAQYSYLQKRHPTDVSALEKAGHLSICRLHKIFLATFLAVPATSVHFTILGDAQRGPML